MIGSYKPTEASRYCILNFNAPRDSCKQLQTKTSVSISVDQWFK